MITEEQYKGLKAGDKVKIRDDLVVGNHYGCRYFVQDMKKGIVTIKKIQYSVFSINEDECGYTRDMIDHIVDDDKKAGSISDGYHTFDELYEHRHTLFCALSKKMNGWKSKFHDDGTMFDGMFIAGIGLPNIGNITYHLPLSMYEMFIGKELEKAPWWDGHTPNDVVDRLKKFVKPNPKALRNKAFCVKLPDGVEDVVQIPDIKQFLKDVLKIRSISDWQIEMIESLSGYKESEL